MNFKKGSSFLWIIFGTLLAIGVMSVITRLNTPENSWICVNNEWVKHGNPDETKPQGKCGDIVSGTDFIEKGNIVKYQGKSTWSLVYEKPGAPALNIPLVFTSKSQCKMGQSIVTCEDELWKQGAKAQVEGVVNGNSVNVLKLTIY